MPKFNHFPMGMQKGYDISMKWRLIDITQETNHPFLNFFTLHYEVSDERGTRPYSYFIASRHEKDEILAKSHSYGHPDGILLCLYRKKESGIEVLLTSQFRPAIGTYLTSFPAGLLDGDEDEKSAASREALEEVGAIIDNIEILAPASPTSSGLSDETVSVALAEIVDEKETELEDFEDITYRYYPLEEIPSILQDKNRLVPINIRLTLLYLCERFKKSF